ncbi:MAG: zinc ribbon domain-containing protein [Desulfamplus sp.]
MALQKCKECGKEVSTKADSCPNCGAKVKKQIGCLQSIFWIFLVLLIISYLAFKEDHLPSTSVGRSSSETVKSSSKVLDADYATHSDVAQAEKFLKDLPDSCSKSYAYASDDGTVTVKIICMGSTKSQSMDGLIKIKDGVVTQVQ